MMESEELSILSNWLEHTGGPHPLYRHLAHEAYAHLRERAARVASLRTAEDWCSRQQALRQTLLDLVGPFPERTPLQPRVVQVVPKDRYRLEKLIFESQPALYVTAALFVPAGLKGRAPGILYLSGHSEGGFRYASYQFTILNLVRKGFVVLAFDPLGQGERRQYLDPESGRAVMGLTEEHSHVGTQCFLAGSCLARYFIWDAVRALDYLVSRAEVDPGRIGCCGRSGGGTQAAYLGAFDERVLAMASENYITSFRRLLESIGPQDAEQNFPCAIAAGLEQADLLAVRAPRPALLVATSRDMFNIQGTYETLAELQRAYRAFGAEGNLRLAEDDAAHASTAANRSALYAFFQEFLALPGNPQDEAVEFLTQEELQVTATGQVATALGGETAFTLNRREAGALMQALGAARQDPARHRPQAIEAARRLSGYAAPQGPGEAVFAGRYRREGYALEKYLLAGEGEYRLPSLLLVPEGRAPHPALLYLHPQGKAAAAAPGGEMEWLARQGYAVLAADLPGTGELSEANDGLSGHARWLTAYAAGLIGRSVVGVHAGDIVRLLRYLQGRSDVDGERILAVARGALGPALLHAAAFDPGIRGVALADSLLSYRSVVMSRSYTTPPDALVPAALTAYDLPDLAAALAPRPLLLVNPTDAHGNPAAEEDLAVIRTAYATAGAAESLGLRSREPWHTPADIFAHWLS